MPTAGIDFDEDIETFNTKSRPFVVPWNGKHRWTELGWDDPVVKAGRFRFLYYPVREWDPRYYDPAITDNIFGPVGVDPKQSTELEVRFSPGKLTFDEWRDRRYWLDPNVRAIYEKYPLTRQHPGVPFRPTGHETFPIEKNFIGNVLPTLGFLRHWPGILPQSWKFHAAPFGEQCHVKTAVAAKYGFLIGTAYFVYYASSYMPGTYWKDLIKKWYHFNKFTIPIGAGWGAATCLAANVRGVDDHWNMIAGGLAAGCVIGAHKGFMFGFHQTLFFTLASYFWYYFIQFEEGIWTDARMHQSNMFSFDPASYKWSQGGGWDGRYVDNPARNF